MAAADGSCESSESPRNSEPSDNEENGRNYSNSTTGRQKSASNSENYLEFTGNRTSDSEMITVEIDLTDPDDLARKLDMVDLTDEETDLLLERAQQLNVWLREQLMQQETPALHWSSSSADKRHRHSATCIVSAPANVTLSDDEDDKKSTVSDSDMRRVRTFSGSRTSLPPLVRRQGHQADVTPATSASYSRVERSPLAPYYSSHGPSAAGLNRRLPSRLPPSLHSVPGKLTASLSSANNRQHPGTDVSRDKTLRDQTE